MQKGAYDRDELLREVWLCLRLQQGGVARRDARQYHSANHAMRRDTCTREDPMRFNRRDILRMSSSSLALMGFGEFLASLVPGATRPTTAAPLSDLSSYDAMGLAELIRTKQITPREVVDDTIRKIEAINPKLNAVIYKTYDRARRRASEPVGGGPFAGVPFLVKDNATIAGVQLTRESRALRGNIPDKTAPFFAAAERAGLILLGAIPGKRILVVDDEPAVVAMLAEMLVADGHHVDTAASGSSALAKLGASTYDVILSDVKMPGLDGPGLYRELKRTNPEYVRRLIFLTGDVLNPRIREFLDQTGAPSLSKPFAVDDLLWAVRDVLQAGVSET